jgi:hypothetical protein
MGESTNTGREYELLVRDIFAQLLKLGGVKTSRVDQDVVLDGKTARHQIDVLWAFEVGGIEYLTVVQAKDWASNVTQEKVLAFKSVLDDIPGQPRGVMVTKTGFQSGAEEYAKAHGIMLYRLGAPSSADLGNRTTKFVASGWANTAIAQEWSIGLDRAWVEERGLTDKLDLVQLPDPKQCHIVGSDGTSVGTLQSHIDELMLIGIRQEGLMQFTRTFATDAYIITGQTDIPRLKISEIIIRVDQVRTDAESTIDYGNMFSMILREVTGEQNYFIDAKGEVRKADQIAEQGVCDFCATEIDAKNCAEYRTIPFRVPMGPNWDFVSDDEWGACPACEELINAGNLKALIERAVEIFVALRGPTWRDFETQHFTRMFEGFWTARLALSNTTVIRSTDFKAAGGGSGLSQLNDK